MTMLTRRDALTGAFALIAGTALPTAPAADAAEFAANDGDDYEVTIWVSVDLDRCHAGLAATAPPGLSRDYCIEAGRTNGASRLRLSPWNGNLQGDDVLTGPPLVELANQTTGPDPLHLLQALLSGGQV